MRLQKTEAVTLRDLIGCEEARFLAEAVTACGAASVSVILADGSVYARSGTGRSGSGSTMPITLEGEVLGCVRVEGSGGFPEQEAAQALARAVGAVVEARKSLADTADVQARIMERSYEELLKAHKKLASSERKYRELSGRLEEEVRARMRELREVHARLLQQHTLASVGRLAAGVAHELNNPAGFIKANLNTLKRYAQRIRTVMSLSRDFVLSLPPGTPGLGDLENAWNANKIDFITSDIVSLVDQAIEGIDRISAIVSSLVDFSGIHEECKEVRLQDKVEEALAMVAPHMPEGSVVERTYEDEGLIEGNPPLISQAFYHVLMNAVQSKKEGLVVSVTVARQGDTVLVAVDDNGPGIPPHIRNRVFEPFFTTRRVGEGAGLGLTIAHRIVTMHAGTIEITQSPRGGARVVMRLPSCIGKDEGGDPEDRKRNTRGGQ